MTHLQPAQHADEQRLAPVLVARRLHERIGQARPRAEQRGRAAEPQQQGVDRARLHTAQAHDQLADRARRARRRRDDVQVAREPAPQHARIRHHIAHRANPGQHRQRLRRRLDALARLAGGRRALDRAALGRAEALDDGGDQIARGLDHARVPRETRYLARASLRHTEALEHVDDDGIARCVRCQAQLAHVAHVGRQQREDLL